MRPIEHCSHIRLSTDSMIPRLLSHFHLIFRGPFHRREGIVHEAQARREGHWSGCIYSMKLEPVKALIWWYQCGWIYFVLASSLG